MKINKLNKELFLERSKRLDELGVGGTVGKAIGAVGRGIQKVGQAGKNFSNQMNVEKTQNTAIAQNNADKTIQTQNLINDYFIRLKKLANNFYVQVKNKKIPQAQQTQNSYLALLKTIKEKVNTLPVTESKNFINKLLIEMDLTGNYKEQIAKYDQLYNAMSKLKPDNEESFREFANVYNNLNKQTVLEPEQKQTENSYQDPKTWDEFRNLITQLANPEQHDDLRRQIIDIHSNPYEWIDEKIKSLKPEGRIDDLEDIIDKAKSTFEKFDPVDSAIDPDDHPNAIKQSHPSSISIKDEKLSYDEILDLYNFFKSSITEDIDSVPENFIKWLSQSAETMQDIVKGKKHFIELLKKGKTKFLEDIKENFPKLYSDMMTDKTEKSDQLEEPNDEDIKLIKNSVINDRAQKLFDSLKENPNIIKPLLKKTAINLKNQGFSNIILNKLNDEEYGKKFLSIILRTAIGHDYPNDNTVSESLDIYLYQEQILESTLKAFDDIGDKV